MLFFREVFVFIQYLILAVGVKMKNRCYCTLEITGKIIGCLVAFLGFKIQQMIFLSDH
jgi:hypothetical protein